MPEELKFLQDQKQHWQLDQTLQLK